MKMFLLILMVLFLIGIAPVNSIESDSNIGNLVATYDGQTVSIWLSLCG